MYKIDDQGDYLPISTIDIMHAENPKAFSSTSTACTYRSKHTRLNNHHLANYKLLDEAKWAFQDHRHNLEKKHRNTGRGGRFGRAAFGGGAYRGKFNQIVLSNDLRKQYHGPRNKIIIEEAVTSQPFREGDPVTQFLNDVDSQSTCKAFIDKDITYAVSDSGASISVTNHATVKLMALELHEWDIPINIKFGNGSETVSTQFAHFGPIIGRVAVVSGAPDTLLSVAVICKRGFNVLFDNKSVSITLRSTGMKVYEGHLDPNSNLYFINMHNIIHSPVQLQKPIEDQLFQVLPDTEQVFMNKHRITKELVKEVFWLHRCMGHASRSTMHKAIKNTQKGLFPLRSS